MASWVHTSLPPNAVVIGSAVFARLTSTQTTERALSVAVGRQVAWKWIDSPGAHYVTV